MRSLSYLCRTFDDIARGEDYDNSHPVYHIGFLDFTLFKDHPEFYAKYQLRNVKDNYLYTDKFNLFVAELNHTLNHRTPQFRDRVERKDDKGFSHKK